MAAKSNALRSAAHDLVITRTYDAPRTLVFAAWTEPERLKHWWAPEGCSTPHVTVDLRPGGKVHFCIRTPDGKDVFAVGIYREVVAPERLVYWDSFADAQGNPVPPSHYGMSADFPAEMLVAIDFTEKGGRTTVTLRQTIPRDFPELAQMEKSWNEMFSRMGQLVASQGSAKAAAPRAPAPPLVMEDLVITRTYDAPRALVFAAWTEPERLKQWWAPDGCTAHYIAVDLRVGGKRHLCIRAPGRDFWAVGTFREVLVPERLVYEDGAGDAEGNRVSARDYGLSGDFPTETQVTVTFTEQGGRTTVTLRQSLPKAFPERAAMEEGWHEMFTRLAQDLAHR